MKSGHDYDAVVVGAGPTGSNTARLLALRGWRVLLLEEHPTVGIPVQCAGLVTPRVFDHCGFPIGDLHQNDLSGALIHAPDGTAVEFDAGAPHAQAMDRAAFDQRCAHYAVAAGAELWTASKAVAARRDADGIDVDIVAMQSVGGAANGINAALVAAGPRQTVRTRLLIGADGIRSSVARWFGLPPVDEIVSAYEAELSNVDIPKDREHLIPMFTGRARAPGFFSWIIPVGNGRARVGLAVAPGLSEAAAKQYYERMFTDSLSAHYLQSARTSYLIIGGIPLGLRSQLVDDRVMVVGDAAGMAKPTSGGGIYMGLVASGHLVDVADPALRRDRLSRGDLLPYERRVTRTIARELRRGEQLRNLFVRLSDDDLNRLARLLNREACVRAIQRHGDIDYASRLVLPLAWAEPALVPFFARILLRPRPMAEAAP